MDDHMSLWQSETWESAHDKAWYRWVKEVEALLGHDLDGNFKEDGYSFDTSYEMWEDALTPETAVARIELAKSLVPRSRND